MERFSGGVLENIPSLGMFCSHTGKQLFPQRENVSLARFHKGLGRLKEQKLGRRAYVSFNNRSFLNNKGRLLRNKRHFSKTSPSLPSERREPSIYGDFVKFISPSISPFIPHIVNVMKVS